MSTMFFVLDFIYHFTYGESNHTKDETEFMIIFMRLDLDQPNSQIYI